MTAGVRMLPCFPCVGDGADYSTFGPQTNGRIPLDEWIMVQGPSASVAQRTVEGHGFLKAKGIVFGIIVFSRNDTASFAGSSTEDHIVMTAYPINHFAFAVLKLL